jgi:N-acetylmuramoyl-L-alanine amidase
MLKRRSILGQWCLSGLGLIATAVSSAGPVRSVTLEASADRARIEVAVDAAGDVQLFTLDGPDRAVLDLEGTSLDRHAVHLPAGTGLVRSVRSGPHGSGVRLVFDLERTATLHRLPASAHTVVIELQSTDKPSVAPPSTAAVVAPPVPPATPPAARADRGTHLPTPRPGLAAHDLVIAVDAGHGGEDPGASGPDGTHEKDITLAIARVLASRIDAEPGMRAVLTRPDDTFIPLRERIHRARAAKADLFVSVHADAVPDHSVAGSSVYVLSAKGATSEAAKWLADRENAADLIGGVSLDDKDNMLASVLLDLSQSAAMSASMTAAEKVLAQLNTVGEVRKTRVQQAGFVVLKSPDIPSMLIETAYITNPGEERRLRDERYQAKLAEAILSGVRHYFREAPLPGTRLASTEAPVAPGVTGRSR